MQSFKEKGLKVAVLVVAMLAAIGGWEVYRGTVLRGQAQTYFTGGLPGGAPLDHFVCYKLIGEDEERFEATVELSNQFTELLGEPVFKRVKDHEKLLCVPTAKNVLSFKAKHHDDRDHYRR